MLDENETSGEPIEDQTNAATESETKVEFSNGFVCLLDALGSKGNWKYDFEDIIKKYDKLQSVITSISNDIGNYFNIKINTIFFSDTLLITAICDKKTLNEYFDDFNKFITSVSLLFSTALIGDTLYRGAISCGDFIQKDKFFIGPAIDEVADYYMQTDWIGIILTPTASYKVLWQKNDVYSPGISLFSNLFLEYKDDQQNNLIPFKNGIKSKKYLL